MDECGKEGRGDRDGPSNENIEETKQSLNFQRIRPLVTHVASRRHGIGGPPAVATKFTSRLTPGRGSTNTRLPVLAILAQPGSGL